MAMEKSLHLKSTFKLYMRKFLFSTIFSISAICLLINYASGIKINDFNTNSPNNPTKEYVIYAKKGDSLITMLKKAHLNQQDYDFLISNPDVIKTFKQLRYTQSITIIKNSNNNLESLFYDFNPEEYLNIKRINNKLISKIIEKTLLPVDTSKKIVIKKSLIVDAQRNKIPHYITMQIIKIFANKIDLDDALKPNDKIKLIYRQYKYNDRIVKTGKILAAEIITSKNTLSAFYFTPGNNQSSYFDEFGRNVNLAFLRIPLHYTRISSPFDLGRMHPILGVVRPHTGVDFAAPSGTPIVSAASGKVIYIGRLGGYGKIIKIKHNKKYKTYYAHLSKFAKHLRRGSIVNKGEFIGRVGQTGFTTGPHLHYELRVYGVPKNPLKEKLPYQNGIDNQHMHNFKNFVKLMQAKLNAIN